jgi:hypothetical protein
MSVAPSSSDANGHAEFVAGTVGPRIEALLRAAEQQAGEISAEVHARAAQRAIEIVADARSEAERMRMEATRRVDDYLAAARRRIDRHAAERLARLNELSDGITQSCEALHVRLHEAVAVRDQLHTLLATIGSVAEAVASEAAVPLPVIAPPEVEQ